MADRHLYAYANLRRGDTNPMLEPVNEDRRQYRSLCISGLPEHITPTSLQTFFESQYGKLQRRTKNKKIPPVHIIQYPSHLTAFVNFQSAHVAQRVYLDYDTYRRTGNLTNEMSAYHALLRTPRSWLRDNTNTTRRGAIDWAKSNGRKRTGRVSRTK